MLSSSRLNNITQHQRLPNNTNFIELALTTYQRIGALKQTSCAPSPEFISISVRAAVMKLGMWNLYTLSYKAAVVIYKYLPHYQVACCKLAPSQQKKIAKGSSQAHMSFI